MEQYKERKFVCRFCHKKFPCGKSLGGHIRTHMNNNNNNSDEDDGQSSYGLRENPKKNKRFVDHKEIMSLKHHQEEEEEEELLCCRECGKGFVSMKALCGHMACHGERDKIHVMEDSQSDTEGSSSPIRRRSKRALKQHNHHKADAFESDSESSSEIETEQEELALSLMMLSRDSTFKKLGHHSFVLNSFAESSDNNSQLKKIFNVKKDVDVLYDSDNSDSGYFRNGPKKLDSDDVSVDMFLMNTTKQDKNLNRFNKKVSGAKYDLRKSKRGFTSYGRKKTKHEFNESVYDSGDHSLETDSFADTNRNIKMHHHSKSSPVAKKASSVGVKKKSKGHECPICFRVFKSGQALGGHKRSHFIGNHEHRTLVIQHHHQVSHEMHTLIDLNLPAPID
ncbi:unnamed protein product [Cochlearia groenlandica]